MSNKKVIYACGDIHGRLDLLVAIRKLIVADAKKRNFEDKTIVYLGDYVDRGPDSCGVIELLMNKPLNDFTSIHLKGNHEEIMFKAVEWSTRTTKSSMQSWRDMWLLNGGMPTLKSYGIDPLALDNDAYADKKVTWSDVRDAIPLEHIYWIKALQNSFIDGDYMFVHAGIMPGLPIQMQKPETMLWIRDRFLNDETAHDYRIIHGHCPTKGFVDFRSNRVNIDTGAVWRGVQFALALHDGEERLIKTPELGRLDDIDQRRG